MKHHVKNVKLGQGRDSRNWTFVRTTEAFHSIFVSEQESGLTLLAICITRARCMSIEYSERVNKVKAVGQGLPVSSYAINFSREKRSRKKTKFILIASRNANCFLLVLFGYILLWIRSWPLKSSLMLFTPTWAVDYEEKCNFRSCGKRNRNNTY